MYTLFNLSQFLGYVEVVRREGPREDAFLQAGNPQGSDTLATLVEGLRFVMSAASGNLVVSCSLNFIQVSPLPATFQRDFFATLAVTTLRRLQLQACLCTLCCLSLCQQVHARLAVLIYCVNCSPSCCMLPSLVVSCTQQCLICFAVTRPLSATLSRAKQLGRQGVEHVLLCVLLSLLKTLHYKLCCGVLLGLG